jgi:hypothetical protein
MSSNESAFAFIDWNGTDLDEVVVHVKHRLVEATIKPDSLQNLELPPKERPICDGSLQLLQLGDDIFLRAFDLETKDLEMVNIAGPVRHAASN